jgi:putative ABC transport system permease protein
MGTLSLTTLWLSIIGIYGVISSFVGTQIREISIGMALGAAPRAILVLFFQQGLLTTVAGLVVGAIVSVLLPRGLQSVLFGVKATDLFAYLDAMALLSAASLLAVYRASAKAVRVDPVKALAYE